MLNDDELLDAQKKIENLLLDEVLVIVYHALESISHTYPVHEQNEQDPDDVPSDQVQAATSYTLAEV